MTEPTTPPATPTRTNSTPSSGGAATGGAYGLGLIGAVVYYVQQADGFTEGLIGVLKALFWPAFLVYELMDSLNM